MISRSVSIKLPRLRTSLTPLLLLFTYGCCSNDIKPGEANLFQAACGVSSGQYKEDLEASEKEAESTRQALQAEKATSEELEGDLKITKARHQKMQQDLIDLEFKNNDVSKQIASLKNESEKDKARNKQLTTQLENLNLDIDTLKRKLAETPDPSQDEELERLKQEVETLRMIVLEQ